jgi:hypothetical protein
MIAREEMHLARAAVDYADAVFKYANMPEEKMEDHMMARFLCLYSAVQSVVQANVGARNAVAKLY